MVTNVAKQTDEQTRQTDRQTNAVAAFAAEFFSKSLKPDKIINSSERETKRAQRNVVLLSATATRSTFVAG